MIQRSRSPITTVLAACSALVVGLGALLVFWGTGPDQSDAGIEPVVSLDGTLPLRGAADELESDAREGRDATADAARDQRAALEHEPSFEAASDIEVEALPVGELEVVVSIGARAADSRPADGWVALQRLEGNDLATPFDRSLTIEAPLEDGVALFTNLPRGVFLVGVHVGSDPPHRTSWVNSRVRGARLEFRLGDARIHGWVRDSGGAAAHGARVWITGRHGTVIANCAADGSFEGGRHFPGGRTTVRVEGHPIADTSPVRTVDVPAAGSLEVSFGPGGDLSRWTGRVLAPDGSLISAADGLPANAVQLAARGGRGRVFDVEVVDGAIDRWFEPDAYALVDRSAVREPAPLGRIVERLDAAPMGAQVLDLSRDLVRDVQLAGFVLAGRVEPPEDDATFVTIGGAGGGVGAGGLRGMRAAVAADGTFRFVALEPGTYELRWGADGVASVTIDARGPVAVEADLVPLR